MSQEITNSLILCSSDRLSDRSALSVTSLLRVVAELESVCDYCYRLAKLTAKRQRKNRVLPEEFEQQLNEFSSWVLQFIEFCQQTLGTKVTGRTLSRGVELEVHIDRSRKQLRRAAMLRMRTSENIEAEMLYVDLVNNMERIGNHCLNTLQAISKPEAFNEFDQEAINTAR